MADTKENDLSEPERLMLARIVAAPDTWRARVSAASGFLGAAAAISFWGLTNSSGGLTSPTKTFIGIATISYVVAVVAFLIASVWAPPKPDEPIENDDVKTAHAYAAKESKPIRRLARIGAGAAAVAIASTALSSFLLVTDRATYDVRVMVTNPAKWKAVSTLCPALQNPFDARTLTVNAGRFKVKVDQKECRHEGTVLWIQESDMTILQRKGDR